jgi:hypothetical protein
MGVFTALVTLTTSGLASAQSSGTQVTDDVNAKDSSGQTPLMLAAASGDAIRVHALIAAHASLESRDNDGRTAIFGAVNLKGCLDCLKQLIAAGADVNASDDNNDITPLMQAVSWGHLDAVEALIAAGADVNARRGGSAAVKTAIEFAQSNARMWHQQQGPDSAAKAKVADLVVQALQRAQQNPIKVATPKATANTVGGRLLSIDVPNKTLQVIPWDAKERRFKSEAIRVLNWTDSTLLKDGSSSLTMAVFLGGIPINKENMFGRVTGQLRTAGDLQGQLYDFYIDQADDKFVVRKMDGVIAFAGVSVAGQVR